MWGEIESASRPLILWSTLGFFSAWLAVGLSEKHLPLSHFPPTRRRVLLDSTSLVNVLAAFAVLAAARPNVGTLASPLTFLPYAGLLTVIAVPIGLLTRAQVTIRLLNIAVLALLIFLLVASLAWIIVGWLPALISFYQLKLFVGVAAMASITLWLALEYRKRARSGKHRLLFAGALYLAIVVEATLIFYVANVLLMIFVGLVWNA